MLRIENLSAGYGSIRALHQISLTVSEGEIVCLIGSNGVGKTTTLKTISGLLRPDEGGIYFDNRDISRTPPHKIVEMGISHVPEGRNVFPRLTVRENLELGAYARKDKAQIKKDFAQVMETFRSWPCGRNRRRHFKRREQQSSPSPGPHVTPAPAAAG